MKLHEVNSHTRDDRIIFIEDEHKYILRDESRDFVSVTELIHKFFPSFDADSIIAKMMKSRNWYNSPYYGMSVDEIKQVWEDKRDLASELGTRLHRTIEMFYNNEEIYDEIEEFEYFLEFNEEHNYFKPFRTEWCIYDEDNMIAGTIDMLYTTNDEFIMCDWKRSKEIKESNKYEEGFYPLKHIPNSNFWHYSLQLNIYKNILERKYDIKISKMILISIHPDNDSYLKYEVPDMQEEVEEILRIRNEEI